MVNKVGFLILLTIFSKKLLTIVNFDDINKNSEDKRRGKEKKHEGSKENLSIVVICLQIIRKSFSLREALSLGGGEINVGLLLKDGEQCKS